MKTAVVTGVDRGLGLAFIEALLKKDWRVVGGHHSEIEPSLMELKKTYGNKLQLGQVDVGEDASVTEFSAFVKRSTDTVDMLINNAAILGKTDSTMEDAIDFEDIVRTLNVNSVGALRVTNGILEKVLASELKLVVNICSEAGSIADNTRDGWFGYCMSKAAMNMGGSIVHQTLKKYGGRVLQIHPGYLKTYMLGRFNDDGKYHAHEAAEKILDVVTTQMTKPVEEQPVYISLEGERLPW